MSESQQLITCEVIRSHVTQTIDFKNENRTRAKLRVNNLD